MDQKTDPTMHLAHESLDTRLKNTDVRLCFGDIDQVLMDLDGCHSMVNLVERIKLHLEAELGNDQISYVEVAQDCDQEFRVKGMKMTRLRLLPGPGLERSYDRFLDLLTSVRSQDEDRSFKFFVHVKGNRGV
jgi:hypothetical protein